MVCEESASGIWLMGVVQVGERMMATFISWKNVWKYLGSGRYQESPPLSLAEKFSTGSLGEAWSQHQGTSLGLEAPGFSSLLP